MCRKIWCDRESEKICKIFWELNKAWILNPSLVCPVQTGCLHWLGHRTITPTLNLSPSTGFWKEQKSPGKKRTERPFLRIGKEHRTVVYSYFITDASAVVRWSTTRVTPYQYPKHSRTVHAYHKVLFCLTKIDDVPTYLNKNNTRAIKSCMVQDKCNYFTWMDRVRTAGTSAFVTGACTLVRSLHCILYRIE